MTLQPTTHLRALGPSDLGDVRRLLDQDPWVNLFVRYRVEQTGLQERLLGGRIWGFYEDDRLVSACHAGANVVPVEATATALTAFAEQALVDGVRPASIVGRQSDVLDLWGLMERHWGPARSPRPVQPFLVLDDDPFIAGDPRVRMVGIDEFDTLYPACVAMFTEEVGVSPEIGGRHGYRARVSQLITHGWAFAIVERGRILFKTEVGAAAGDVCQLQGVYVDPSLRGRGIAGPALAEVVRQVRRTVAPVVTLYVNDHNVAARRTYEQVGFREHATFASILL